MALDLTPTHRKHKTIKMRTTLDLPDDVGITLRQESAGRGGRGRAPLSLLVAEAVRAKFGETPRPSDRILDRVGDFPIVRRTHRRENIDHRSIDQALDEDDIP